MLEYIVLLLYIRKRFEIETLIVFEAKFVKSTQNSDTSRAFMLRIKDLKARRNLHFCLPSVHPFHELSNPSRQEEKETKMKPCKLSESLNEEVSSFMLDAFLAAYFLSPAKAPTLPVVCCNGKFYTTSSNSPKRSRKRFSTLLFSQSVWGIVFESKSSVTFLLSAELGLFGVFLWKVTF